MMRIKYSYVSVVSQEMNPMVSGGSCRISGEDDVISFLETISFNSNIKNHDGSMWVMISELTF